MFWINQSLHIKARYKIAFWKHCFVFLTYRYKVYAFTKVNGYRTSTNVCLHFNKALIDCEPLLQDGLNIVYCPCIMIQHPLPQTEVYTKDPFKSKHKIIINVKLGNIIQTHAVKNNIHCCAMWMHSVQNRQQKKVSRKMPRMRGREWVRKNNIFSKCHKGFKNT